MGGGGNVCVESGRYYEAVESCIEVKQIQNISYKFLYESNSMTTTEELKVYSLIFYHLVLSKYLSKFLRGFALNQYPVT